MATCVRIRLDRCIFKRNVCTSVLMYKEFGSEHERLEAGKQDRIIHGQKYEEWRKRWGERSGEWTSKFKVFQIDGPPKESELVKFRQLPLTLDFSVWDKYFLNKRELKEQMDQSFFEERHRLLGNDLAATHFMLFRGGAVMFKGASEWIREDPTKEDSKLPVRYVEGLFVERIDGENMRREGIRYDGLLNLDNLHGLKWLSFKGNIHFDDWCMERLGSFTLPILEYLDVSNCPISYRGLIGLAKIDKLNKLKFLVISNKNKCEDMDQVCAILEEYYPNLLIKIEE